MCLLVLCLGTTGHKNYPCTRGHIYYLKLSFGSPVKFTGVEIAAFGFKPRKCTFTWCYNGNNSHPTKCSIIIHCCFVLVNIICSMLYEISRTVSEQVSREISTDLENSKLLSKNKWNPCYVEYPLKILNTYKLNL